LSPSVTFVSRQETRDGRKYQNLPTVAKSVCGGGGGDTVRAANVSTSMKTSLSSTTNTEIITSASQPITEMSTRNIQIIMFLRSKVRRVRRANSLTDICELIV
jgi:hypothetical protein